MPSDPAASSPTAWWLDGRARWLVGLGIVLIASGLLHLVVWGVRGGAWEGPVTWRKPILFGVSAGLTGISLGWAWARLPWRRGDAALAALTAWSLVVEVGLIDLQAWRGVASHFNRRTPLDSFLYDAMGALILVVTLVALDLAIRAFRQPLAVVAPDMRLALRAGLVFLVVSCGLGIWASVHGDLRAAHGLAPEVLGSAGVVKFPHGMVIHALQWLPLLAWAAARARLPERRRVTIVAAATVGTAILLAYALLQTLAGRARFDAPWPVLAIGAAGGALLAGAALVVAVAWAARGATGPGDAARAP
ncbi:MAG: hypothetical protein ACKO5R_01880 [Planctomycetaceae bacterium]